MKNTTLDVRRGIKRVKHTLIEVWAAKHHALEHEMREVIGKMTDDEIQALRNAASSLTATNCWFAEYDVRPMIEELLDAEVTSRRKKPSHAAPNEVKGEK